MALLTNYCPSSLGLLFFVRKDCMDHYCHAVNACDIKNTAKIYWALTAMAFTE